MDRIKNIFIRFSAWWRRQRRRVKFGIILLLLLGVFFAIKGKPDDGSTIETAKQQTLSRTVTASGSVVSSTDLSLSFEASKIVDSVRVAVGQKVKKGDILATEKNGTERAAYNVARGSVLAAEARYNKVLEGSSNEEIALAQVSLNNAKKDLENTTKVHNGLVENARRKLNSEGLSAETTVTTAANSAPIISGTYTGIEGMYTLTVNSSGGDGYISYSGIESGVTKVSTISPQPLGTKGLSIIFPNGATIQSGTWTVAIPNTTSSVYVTNLNGYQSAQNTREQAISSAQSVVDSAEAQLNLKRATARQPEVDAALADIISARAQMEQAGATLEKTILRAPADGTITKVDIKIGQVPEAMKEAMILQDISNLYLEANINETSISEVAIGQTVTVTFDALPNAPSYIATLSSIDPAGTVANNVVNYKVKALLTDTANIRPGMTANMSILTKKVDGAIVIPGRTVTYKDGVYSVLKITEARRKKTVSQPVTIGIHGDGDLWEVLSGLSVGDQVLWVPPEK